MIDNYFGRQIDLTFQFLSNNIKHGCFPFWTPNTFSGFPIYTDPQAGYCYPIHLILFGLFRPERAFGWDLGLHLFFAGWLTYLFLRQLGTKRPAAILSGICFMFSGFLVPKLLIPALIFSAMYLPLILLGIERLCAKPRFANLVLLGFAIAFLMLAGYPQYVMTILVFSAIYTIVRIVQLGIQFNRKIEFGKGTRLLIAILFGLFIGIIACLMLFTSIPQLKNLVQIPVFVSTCSKSLIFILLLIWALSIKHIILNRKLISTLFGYFIIAVILATLLSAVYLYPAYELYQHSSRVGLPTSEYISGIYFFENIKLIIKDLFTGSGIIDFEISGYIGSTPFVILILALALGIMHIRFKKHAVMFWIFIGLSGSLVFLDPALTDLVSQHVPIVNYFFIYHRYLLILVFALSGLAGFALHNITEYIETQNPVQLANLNYRYLLSIAGISIILALLFSLSNQPQLMIKIIPAVGIVLIYLLTSGQGLVRIIFPASIILISLIELYPKTVGYPITYIYPSQLYPAKTINTTLKERDPEPYRIVSMLSEKVAIPYQTGAISFFLLPNVASIYGIRDAQGFNPVLLKEYRDYIDMLNQDHQQLTLFADKTHYAMINTTDSRLLDLLNVKYITSPIPLNTEKLTLLYSSSIVNRNYQIPIFIYRNNDYLPNAYIVHQAKVCRNIHQTLLNLTNPEFDPQATVILNESFGTLVEKQENLIGKTKVRAPRAITVISSPQTASIQIDGKEICDNQPGFNIAVLNQSTHDLDDLTVFSSLLSVATTSTERSPLAVYLDAIPAGKIVVIAWKGDTASFLMTEDIVSTLQSLGAVPDKFHGNTLALIGVKGANPGEAMQSTFTPTAELAVPYPIDIVYRFDEKKLILPEPGNTEDTAKFEPQVTIIHSQVNTIKYAPNQIKYQAILFQPGFLVLSELDYPGWVAFVDGKPTRILKANGIFKTVFLNPGKHQVELRFIPMKFWYGLIITGITLLTLIIIGIIRLRKQRRIEA
ncbi:MAG: YfhO family protein [bacterium]